MRTTVTIDDDVLRAAKVRAAAEGTTLSALVTRALRDEETRAASAPRRPVSLPVFTGNGVLPGVDLSNNAALLDLMDGVE